MGLYIWVIVFIYEHKDFGFYLGYSDSLDLKGYYDDMAGFGSEFSVSSVLDFSDGGV